MNYIKTVFLVILAVMLLHPVSPATGGGEKGKGANASAKHPALRDITNSEIKKLENLDKVVEEEESEEKRNKMLEDLGMACIFAAEWEALGRGEDPKKYRSFTSREIWVPYSFLVLHALTASVALIVAIGWITF